MDTQLSISSHLVIPLAELQFRTSRSGGPGGQNVNKLETRVELLFDLAHSPCLTDEQRGVLLKRLNSKLDSDGVLRVVAQESRSQWKNKREAIEKFAKLLRAALKPVRKRVATSPTRMAKEKRIQSKKLRGERKRARRKTHFGDE